MSRHSDEDKRLIVQDWDRSGMSAAEFGRTRGIHPSTLSTWGRLVRGPLPNGGRKRPQPRSIEVVEVLRKESGGERKAEISLRSGRRITLFGSWSPADLGELVRAMESEG